MKAIWIQPDVDLYICFRAYSSPAIALLIRPHGHTLLHLIFLIMIILLSYFNLMMSCDLCQGNWKPLNKQLQPGEMLPVWPVLTFDVISVWNDSVRVSDGTHFLIFLSHANTVYESNLICQQTLLCDRSPHSVSFCEIMQWLIFRGYQGDRTKLCCGKQLFQSVFEVWILTLIMFAGVSSVFDGKSLAFSGLWKLWSLVGAWMNLVCVIQFLLHC